MPNYLIKIGAKDAQGLIRVKGFVSVYLGGTLIGRERVTGLGSIGVRIKGFVEGHRIIREYEQRSARRPTRTVERWEPESESLPPWPDGPRPRRWWKR